MNQTREEYIENIKKSIKNNEKQEKYKYKLAEEIKDETITLKEYYKKQGDEVTKDTEKLKKKIEILENITNEDIKKFLLDKLNYVKNRGFNINTFTEKNSIEDIQKECDRVKENVKLSNCYMNRDQWFVMTFGVYD